MNFEQESFKQFLRKVGSGVNTSRGLTREESAKALKLILTEKASPAQIGAFMMAHRIRRPEPQELAGMLDAYKELGPLLTSQEGQKPPICFGMPLDGRTKTSPIYPLTTLILLSANQSVILHGGKRMPVKYGVTPVELFKAIGLSLTNLPIQKVQECFNKNGFSLIHQPDHFKLAENMISYREEIGKRPPIASMELIWTAHQGNHLLINGFVHPPTEKRAIETLTLLGENNIITIKGLEGGIDIPISRPCITGHKEENTIKRLILHPRDYKFQSKDLEWNSLEKWSKDAIEALNFRGPLKEALTWNGAVYLWFSGVTQNLDEGIKFSELLLSSGAAMDKLNQIINWKAQIDI